MRPKGLKHSEETKRKISESLKGRKFSDETKAKLSASQKGHVFRGKRGYKMSEESRENIRKGIEEKRATEEYFKKLSITKKGEKNPQTKLTENDVLEIRRIYSAKLLSQQKIADQYRVHRSTIADIVNHRTWTHLE